MSKYLKTYSLSNTSVSAPAEIGPAPSTQNSPVAGDGYTDSDLSLFGSLMNYKNYSPGRSGVGRKSVITASTQYTDDDIRQFKRLLPDAADPDDSTVVSDTGAGSEGDPMKIRYFDAT